VERCTTCLNRHRNLPRTERTNLLAMRRTGKCRTYRLWVPRSSKWKLLRSAREFLGRHRTNCQHIDCSCSQTGRTNLSAMRRTGKCRTCRPSVPRSSKWKLLRSAREFLAPSCHRTNCQHIGCSCSQTGRTSRWATPRTDMCHTCQQSGPRSNKWRQQRAPRGQF
jgi:Holliday junction resolvase-like predicted endonuclease